MKSRKDIKDYCLDHLAANPGLAERIQNRVGFEVQWSKMDILQTVLVFLACEAECGNINANSALAGMMVYMNDKNPYLEKEKL